MKKLNIFDSVFIIYCILPFLGAMDVAGFSLVGKVLNILSYAFISYVLIRVDKRFSRIVLVALLLKIGHIFLKYDFFQHLFVITTSLLIFAYSAFYYVKDPQKFKFLLKAYVLITIPLVILQSLGVFESLHLWNTLFFDCQHGKCSITAPIINMIGHQFLSLDAFSAQFRPPGILHSNALLAPTISMALCYFMFDKSRKFTLTLLLCVVLATFSMSKIVQLQLIMLAALYLYLNNFKHTSKAILLILVWLACLLIYEFIVPGFIPAVLNVEAYLWSALSRVLDFYGKYVDHDMVLEKKEMIRQVTGVGVYVAPEKGGMSGIGQLGLLMPLFIYIFYKARKLYQDVSLTNRSWLQDNLPWNLYVSLILIFISQYLVTALWGFQIIFYFQGLLLVPFLSSHEDLIARFRTIST